MLDLPKGFSSGLGMRKTTGFKVVRHESSTPWMINCTERDQATQQDSFSEHLNATGTERAVIQEKDSKKKEKVKTETLKQERPRISKSYEDTREKRAYTTAEKEEKEKTQKEAEVSIGKVQPATVM